MHSAIEACLKPKRGLLIFPTYLILRQWIDDNKENLDKNQILYNNIINRLSFPNGNELYLGQVSCDDDMLKYAGTRFNFVMGHTASARFWDTITRP